MPRRAHLGSLISIGFVCLAALPAATSAQQRDWPSWRGPNGNSISDESGWDPNSLAPEPKILWRARVGDGYSSVSIKGEHLYTMGYMDGRDTVYCLAVATGKEIWRYTYPCIAGSYAGPRATPVFSDSLLYTLSREGGLYCFDAQTGKVKWRKNLKTQANTEIPRWGTSSSAVVEGSLLLLNVGKYGLALDKQNGDVIWQSPREVPGYASPVPYDLDGKRCAVMFGRDAAYGVAVETGELLWTKKWHTRMEEHSSDPIVWDGNVFISSIYSKGCTLFSVAKGTPREIWLNDKLVTKFSTSVLFEGNLYGIHGNTGRGTLRCLDFETGATRWEEKFKFASPIIVDGKLIILDEKGMLYIAKASPDGYDELSRGQVLQPDRTSRGKWWTAPVLCRGMIFCRNDRGAMACVDVRKSR